MGLRLVTVATDGATNFVVTSDGQKYNLGAIPVLKFVMSTVVGRSEARRICEEFLKKGKALFKADADRMDKFFVPKRVRFASPLIDSHNQGSYSRGTGKMADTDTALKAAIEAQVGKIEAQVALLEQKAKEASPGSLSQVSMKSDIEALKDLVKTIGDAPKGQSENDANYGPAKKEASLDHLNVNSAMSEEILEKVDATRTTIDRLVQAGRKFNASKAREDLHAVTSKLHNILVAADLAEPWIGNDLQELASRADHIHGLFAGSK